MVKARHTENDRCILVAGPKERMLCETEVIVCQYSGMYLASGLYMDSSSLANSFLNQNSDAFVYLAF